MRIRKIPSSHRNPHINRHTQEPLQVIALLVPQEIPHRQNSQDQHSQIKNLKAKTHGLAQPPAHQNDQRSVKQGRLERGAEHVRQGKVHLVVVCLVHGGQMLGGLFDEGDEDQADEGVCYVALFYEEGDLVDEGDGDDGDEGDGDDEGDDALDKGEPVDVHLLVPVVVVEGVFLEDGVVNAVVGAGLEEDVDEVGHYEEDGHAVGDVKRLSV